jgi:hypothetical protein
MWESMLGTTIASIASRKRQIVLVVLLRTRGSTGTGGSFSFLHRQEEQGRSSSWLIEEASGADKFVLAPTVGMNIE